MLDLSDTGVCSYIIVILLLLSGYVLMLSGMVVFTVVAYLVKGKNITTGELFNLRVTGAYLRSAHKLLRVIILTF